MEVNNIEDSNLKALLEIDYIVSSCMYTENEKLEKITEALKVNKSEKEMFNKELEKRNKEFLENAIWNKDLSTNGTIIADNHEEIIKDAPKNIREQK